MFPPTNPDDSGRPFERRVKRGRGLQPALLCGMVVSGSIGLLSMAGGKAADDAVSAALPVLQASWSRPVLSISATRESGSGLVRAATRPDGEFGTLDLAKSEGPSPHAGDEGFWLSPAALAGNSGQKLSMGDPITIGDRHYLITELTPLSAANLKNTPAKPSHGLTLVVASEVSDGHPTSPPRRLRFLVDSLPPALPAAPMPTPQAAQGTL